ncbi:MAG: hypothetical protein HY875_16665 [Chloroflexi bacterium]|nr:hypothetical protein [Chloroflexota bacterium]
MASDRVVPQAPAVSGLAQTSWKVLFHLKRNGPATAEDVAGDCDITPRAARHQLGLLEAAGFVTHRSLPSEFPGRPRNTYEIASSAEALFPVSGLDFVLKMFLRVAENHPEIAAEAFAAESAAFTSGGWESVDRGAPLPARLEQLGAAMENVGFVAAVDVPFPGAASFALRHCPLWYLARRFPAICDLEDQTIRGIFPESDVQLVEARLEGAAVCRWTLRANGPSRACQ